MVWKDYIVSPHHCTQKLVKNFIQLTFYSDNVEVSEDDNIGRRANLLKEERQTERQFCSYVLKGKKG